MIEFKFTMTIDGKSPFTVKTIIYPEISQKVEISWPTTIDPVYTRYGTMLFSDAVKYCADYNLDFTYVARNQEMLEMYKTWGWPEKNIFLIEPSDDGKKVSFSNGYSGIYCSYETAVNVYNARNAIPFTVGFVNDTDNEYIPIFQFGNFGGAVAPNIGGAIFTNSIIYSKFYPGDNSSGLRCRFYTPEPTAITPQRASEAQLKFFTSVQTDDDPYDQGGGSGTGGGGGSFDNTSTPIEIPGLPSISAASTGFISLYNPTLSQLNELSSYLWSDLFSIDTLKKLFANPMDAILGLSILPVAIPGGGVQEVKVGNIGTGISLTVAASQFVEVDCGSIDVNEYWGAYLDYEPYTQAQIFLPYIGTRPISVDEIMGKTVRVVYHVDILTGACCCFVKCGSSVLYTYNGQCSIPIPITSSNYTSVVNGVISVAASVGSLVATGGASAPIAVPNIANSVVNQMKPQIEKSGSISGSAGILNMQIPYLILIRPRQALPSKQNEFIGYPSLITVKLTELTGYTEVQSIHLENIPATQEELTEIETLLMGGVIF